MLAGGQASNAGFRLRERSSLQPRLFLQTPVAAPVPLHTSTLEAYLLHPGSRNNRFHVPDSTVWIQDGGGPVDKHILYTTACSRNIQEPARKKHRALDFLCCAGRLGLGGLRCASCHGAPRWHGRYCLQGPGHFRPAAGPNSRHGLPEVGPSRSTNAGTLPPL